MKGDKLHGLADRIRYELNELERVLNRITEGWKRAQRGDDDYYLDSVALNLHGFYSGLERIFTLIAEIIDSSLPQGENWHLHLMKQMMEEKPPFRPAVISESVGERLNAYRGFRHVVRNVYTYRFDPQKIEKLVLSAPNLFVQLKAELLAFAAFIES